MVHSIKRSVLVTEEQIKGGADIKKSMIQENEDINSTIKNYLSRADQFAVRMSSAIGKSMSKSGIGTSNQEQSELFVDKANINLTKRSTLEPVEGHAHRED
jgi:hypothetical protein